VGVLRLDKVVGEDGGNYRLRAVGIHGQLNVSDFKELTAVSQKLRMVFTGCS